MTKKIFLLTLFAAYLYTPVSMSAEWSCDQHYKNIGISEDEIGLKFTSDIAWREALYDLEDAYNDGDVEVYERIKSLYDEFGLTYKNSANGKSCKENIYKNRRFFNFVSAIHEKIKEKEKKRQIEEDRKLAASNSDFLKRYKEDLNNQKIKGYKDIKFGMTEEEFNQTEASKGVVLFGEKRNIKVYYSKDPSSGVEYVHGINVIFLYKPKSFDLMKDIFNPDKIKEIKEGISYGDAKGFTLFYEHIVDLLSKKYDICYKPNQTEEENFLAIDKGQTTSKDLRWCFENGSIAVLAFRNFSFGELIEQKIFLVYMDQTASKTWSKDFERKKVKREEDRLKRLKQEKIKNKKTTIDDF